MKTILVVPNQSGDGATAFTRDLTAALASLKSPAPDAMALDFADGELWRQAKRQDGFLAYPSTAFDAAWSRYVARARQTMPEDDLSTGQRERLARLVQSGIDYLVYDSRSSAPAANVDMVLLVARCDPRNLATLRRRYQDLVNANPNTYIVLLQGSSHGQVGYVTSALSTKIAEKGVQALRANGAPLVVPQHIQAYTIAAREGLPVFRIPESEHVSADDLRALRSIHHEAAVEVRRLLARAEAVANRQRAAAGAA